MLCSILFITYMVPAGCECNHYIKKNTTSTIATYEGALVYPLLDSEALLGSRLKVSPAEFSVAGSGGEAALYFLYLQHPPHFPHYGTLHSH